MFLLLLPRGTRNSVLLIILHLPLAMFVRVSEWFGTEISENNVISALPLLGPLGRLRRKLLVENAGGTIEAGILHSTVTCVVFVTRRRLTECGLRV